jgi:hypothetical protein
MRIKSLAWLLAALVMTIATPARADYRLVRNAKNPTPKVSKEGVRGLFSGKTKNWSNGQPVILVIGSEDAPAMQWLADAYFHVSAKTYLAKIKQDVFRGELPHPLSADDDAKTLKRVQSNADAVGFVTDAAAKALPADLVVVGIE